MKKIFISLFFACSVLASFAQDQLPKGSATGTNTYAVTIAGGPAVLSDGLQIVVKLANANTNTSTLNVNSLGAKAVKLNGVALVSGDLPANVYMLFTYNASTSSWQVSKPGSGGGSPPAGAWSLTGNALGADTKWLGSSDNFNVGFKTNNTVRETILKGGQHIWGSGTTLSGSETYSFQGGDVYVDDNFLVNNAINTSNRTVFGGDWVYGDNYGAQYVARSLVDKNYVDSSFTANPVEITVGTTPVNSGTSGAIPFNSAGVYGEDATKLFWENATDELGIGTNVPGASLDIISADGGTSSYKVFNLNSSLGNNLFFTQADGNTRNYGKLQVNFAASPPATFNSSVFAVHNGTNQNIKFDTYNSNNIIESMNDAFNAYVPMYLYASELYLWNNAGVGYTSLPASTRFAVKGTTSDNSAFGLLIEAQDGSDIIKSYNNGRIGIGAIGTQTHAIFIGFDGTGAASTGDYNTIIGESAFTATGAGNANTGMGQNVLDANTSGATNCAFGVNAMYQNTTGSDNVAVGYTCLAGNQIRSVAVGSGSLGNHVSGDNNVGVGWFTLQTSSTGEENTAIGSSSQSGNTIGHRNASLGFKALATNTTGTGNTAIGTEAGFTTISSGGVFLGFNAGYHEGNDGNRLYIDNQKRGTTQAETRTQALVYGVFDATVANQVFTHNSKVLVNGRMEQQQGADVASVAGAITLGTDGNTFEITGTNAITLISNVGWQNGSKVTLLFTSTATIASGTATSGTDITVLLNGGATYVGSAGSRLVLELGEIGGTQAWREISRSAPTECIINTTAGDAATINAMCGRFRKDNSGTTFTLTNSFITANSIIVLQPTTFDATATRVVPLAGSGSAVITFDAVPDSDWDINFIIKN